MPFATDRVLSENRRVIIAGSTVFGVSFIFRIAGADVGAFLTSEKAQAVSDAISKVADASSAVHDLKIVLPDREFICSRKIAYVELGFDEAEKPSKQRVLLLPQEAKLVAEWLHEAATTAN
jgi:hypothetical protein